MKKSKKTSARVTAPNQEAALFISSFCTRTVALGTPIPKEVIPRASARLKTSCTAGPPKAVEFFAWGRADLSAP